MNSPIIRNLGLQPYLLVYDMMHQFTLSRNANTTDEIWLVEHPPVYTQGKVGKPEHVLRTTSIPIIKTDRGGQITYHAPGQQIMYILLDIKRLKYSIHNTVSNLENSVIKTLQDYTIPATSKPNAPGVYVNNEKICSLGLNIYRGCTLHGLALNVDMDLTPFNNINPCGYSDLKMTQMIHYISTINRDEICQKLIHYFVEQIKPFYLVK